MSVERLLALSLADQGGVMALPDIDCVAEALRQRPYDFFIQDGRLRHKDSTAGFVVHRGGLIAAETGSDGRCRLLPRQDALQLSAAFEEWQRDYWIAARVNSIFRPQLRPPGIWRRLWHSIERRLPQRERESALAIYAHSFAGDEFAGPGPNGERPSRRRPRPQGPPSGGNATELRPVLHSIE